MMESDVSATNRIILETAEEEHTMSLDQRYLGMELIRRSRFAL